MPRSESDMNAKTPLQLALGEKKYTVPILRAVCASRWRDAVVTEFHGVVDAATDLNVIDVKAFSNGLTGYLIQFPEKLAKLVFLYADYAELWNKVRAEKLPEEAVETFLAHVDKGEVPKSSILPRGEILADATEEQIGTAFSALMEVAYPYLPQARTVTKAVRASLSSPQPTARYTN